MIHLKKNRKRKWHRTAVIWTVLHLSWPRFFSHLRLTVKYIGWIIDYLRTVFHGNHLAADVYLAKIDEMSAQNGQTSALLASRQESRFAKVQRSVIDTRTRIDQSMEHRKEGVIALPPVRGKQSKFIMFYLSFRSQQIYVNPIFSFTLFCGFVVFPTIFIQRGPVFCFSRRYISSWFRQFSQVTLLLFLSYLPNITQC